MNASRTGWINGLLGVLIFSGSLPATRVAVAGFEPLFLTSARAAIAAVLACMLLLMLKQTRPTRADIPSLLIVSVGVIIGFPLLTALALQRVTAAHSIVFIGLLPLATALFGVLRGAERPKPVFWSFSCTGSVLVAGFAATQSSSTAWQGDLLMLGAILLCGLGYAEGAALSRRLGGWQVISWALVLSLPVMSAIAIYSLPEQWSGIEAKSWIGFAYVSVFSMLIGFIFWYRGLALGGIAGVGQLQLLQPFFGFIWVALLLDEPIKASMVAVTALVVVCVIGAKRYA